MVYSPHIILVISCQANRESRQRAIRETWLRRLPAGNACYFVEGGHDDECIVDGRIQLATPDGYDDLAEKSFRAIEFILRESDCQGIIKCDDDTYVHPQRCMDAIDTFADYNGNRTQGQDHFSPYAQGGCYWLSRKAMEAVVSAPFESHVDSPWFKGNTRMRKLGEGSYRESTSIEDVMVGSLLAKAGFELTDDGRFNVQIRPVVYLEHELISNHYVSPKWMYRIDRMAEWRQTLFNRLLMRLWTSLPSASKPR
ncbi:MAG: hypothetical protein AB3N63_08725 [Puniceicoccaceae bacterium]